MDQSENQNDHPFSQPETQNNQAPMQHIYPQVHASPLPAVNSEDYEQAARTILMDYEEATRSPLYVSYAILGGFAGLYLCKWWVQTEAAKRSPADTYQFLADAQGWSIVCGIAGSIIAVIGLKQYFYCKYKRFKK